MKYWIRNQGAIIGIIFILIWILPGVAFSQKASIRDVLVKAGDGTWKVSFSVDNCFPEKMQEAIRNGIPATFVFYLQVYQVKSWWRDQKLVSLPFQHTIQYSPIRGEYQVTFGEKGMSRVTLNFEEAKTWMARVQEVEMKVPPEMKPGSLTYLRIKAELDPVKLPLHLEYLFFFVSLWDFETDWQVETLSP
jgi:hypothetical protein